MCRQAEENVSLSSCFLKINFVRCEFFYTEFLFIFAVDKGLTGLTARPFFITTGLVFLLASIRAGPGRV